MLVTQISNNTHAFMPSRFDQLFNEGLPDGKTNSYLKTYGASRAQDVYETVQKLLKAN